MLIEYVIELENEYGETEYVSLMISGTDAEDCENKLRLSSPVFVDQVVETIVHEE